MRWSVAGIFGSTVTLLGAFLVGVVIHRSLVLGEFSVLAPAGVLGLAGGLALIAIGRRLEERFQPSEYVPGSEDDEEEEEDEGGEFDERFSPVPQDRLERREAAGDGPETDDAPGNDAGTGDVTEDGSGDDAGAGDTDEGEPGGPDEGVTNEREE